MAAIKSPHSRVLEQLIAHRRQKLVESILAGVPENYYREFIGEVRGLDAALKLSEEADYKLSGDFNDDGA